LPVTRKSLNSSRNGADISNAESRLPVPLNAADDEWLGPGDKKAGAREAPASGRNELFSPRLAARCSPDYFCKLA
jgi:hypothetical protein